MSKDNTEEYRNNITMHLTRMSGDIEHIKESIASINENVKLINGRLRKAENNITGMKSVGFTLYAIIGIILTWLGVKE
jgi:peptidoglycan hydrolase CwlO-like protein